MAGEAEKVLGSDRGHFFQGAPDVLAARCLGIRASSRCSKGRVGQVSRSGITLPCPHLPGRGPHAVSPSVPVPTTPRHEEGAHPGWTGAPGRLPR